MALGAAVFAQIAYSNFGTGDSYNNFMGWTVGGPFPDKDRTAMQFTANITGTLVGVRFASWYVTGSSDLDILLREDSAGSVGPVMKSWSITRTDPTSTIASLTNTDLSVIVNAGSTYWLDISTNTDGHHAWNVNDQSVLGRRAVSIDNGTSWTYADSQTIGVFDVRLEPVPEPASMIALGAGAAALIARRRRKHASVK